MLLVCKLSNSSADPKCRYVTTQGATLSSAPLRRSSQPAQKRGTRPAGTARPRRGGWGWAGRSLYLTPVSRPPAARTRTPQVTSHRRCAVLGRRRAAKREPRKTSFQTEESAQKKGASRKPRTHLWKPSWQKRSRGARAARNLCSLLLRRLPPAEAACPAARRPGEGRSPRSPAVIPSALPSGEDSSLCGESKPGSPAPCGHSAEGRQGSP